MKVLFCRKLHYFSFNPIALRMAKNSFEFGHFECIRVNMKVLFAENYIFSL